MSNSTEPIIKKYKIIDHVPAYKISENQYESGRGIHYGLLISIFIILVLLILISYLIKHLRNPVCHRQKEEFKNLEEELPDLSPDYCNILLEGKSCFDSSGLTLNEKIRSITTQGTVLCTIDDKNDKNNQNENLEDDIDSSEEMRRFYLENRPKTVVKGNGLVWV